LLAKLLAKATDGSHVTVTTVLALAALTKNRNGPIFVALPKVAKASK
jgi:hypothetical protein